MCLNRKSIKRTCPLITVFLFNASSVGLFEAIEQYGIQWGVIKAVSDFADGSKDLTEQWQKFSSVMAASVVHNIFKQGVMKDWPRSSKEVKDGKGIHFFDQNKFLFSLTSCCSKSINSDNGVV